MLNKDDTSQYFIKFGLLPPNLTCYLLSQLSPKAFTDICPLTTDYAPLLSNICHIEYHVLTHKTHDITSDIFKKKEDEFEKVYTNNSTPKCPHAYFKMNYSRTACHFDYSSLGYANSSNLSSITIKNDDT